SGNRRSMTPSIRNGTIPTQEVPSNSWIRSGSGTSGRTWVAGTGQWAKRRSHQVCRHLQGVSGWGQGL
ncbi:MAG: hypothetical protein R3224_04150, partial [Balneolaceae bacterium]|nr:hypothetical protein [Balneolaceae bacterium]